MASRQIIAPVSSRPPISNPPARTRQYNKMMQTIAAICAGIALAAACGFRVFLPLLAASLAVHFNYLQPSPSMAWVGSTPAILILAIATIAEIAAYYIPWIDNALDTIASPAAVVAGTFVAATAFGDIHPAFKWAAALIAGGGVAAGIQTTTVATRAASTATTGGITNHIVATLELIGAILLAVLAILLPIMAIGLLLILATLIVRWWLRRRKTQPVGAMHPTAQ